MESLAAVLLKCFVINFVDSKLREISIEKGLLQKTILPTQMNYLSHYYIYQDNKSNPLYTLGLVFPDLSRGFVSAAGKKDLPLHPHLDPLVLGCRKHYEADKIFHACTFFEEGSHLCVEVLKKARFETEVPRRWFIGHILFELLLDRILVRHQPQVCIDFYNDLNALNREDLKEFIGLHAHKDQERFLKFFEHFCKAAYIRNYPDNNLFAFSLSRIILKAGLPALSLTDKIVLQECVWELEETRFKESQGVLFELKEVFK